MKITTETIFTESKKMLLTGGYDNLTFAKLSENLGVTRPALYKHYKNKDELILELMVVEMTAFMEEFKKLILLSESEIMNRLFEQFIKFGDIHQMMESLYRINYRTETLLNDKMKTLREYHSVYKSELDRVLEKGKEAGLFQKDLPNELLSQFIMQTINIINKDSSSEEIGLVKQMIFRGIGTK